MSLSEKHLRTIQNNSEAIRKYIYERCNVCDLDMPWDGADAEWIYGEPWDLDETVHEAISEVCALELEPDDLREAIRELDLTCPGCGNQWESGTLVALESTDPIDLEYLAENKHKIDAVQVSALIGFADISGFSEWMQRSVLSDVERKAFMSEIIREFVKFKASTPYYVKLLGDGLMVVHKVAEKSERGVVIESFLERVHDLVDRVENIISRTAAPRPKGFRARVTYGEVFEISATDVFDKSKRQTDYIGYTVNLAARLLSVEEAIPLICSERVAELCTRRVRVEFAEVAPSMTCLKGIDKEDLMTLKRVKVSPMF